MGKQRAERENGMAYIRMHPDVSDGQLARELSVARETIRRWRQDAGVAPLRWGGVDRGLVPREEQPIQSWNDAVVVLAKYAHGLAVHMNEGYVLDLPEQAAKVPNPIAREKVIPLVIQRLREYQRLLQLQATVKRT